MMERMRHSSIETFLRKDTTGVARAFDKISPPRGQDYLNSGAKRTLDIACALPSLAISLPVIGVCAAVRIAEGDSPFYTQQRIGKNLEAFTLVKLNAMKNGVDTSPQVSIAASAHLRPEDDPRNTRFGRVMQKYDLVELPQFLQIILGKMSFIGIRAAPQYIFDYLKQVRPDTFYEWRNAYLHSRPGLSGLNAVYNRRAKDDKRRHHYDVFYSRKASLGLDMLILYKTFERFLRKFRVLNLSS